MHLFISKSNCWHTVFFLAFLCLEISPEEKKNPKNKQHPIKKPKTTTTKQQKENSQT